MFAQLPILVVAPIETVSEINALRAYAWTVATELGVSTTYATHSEYSVTDFAEVHVPFEVLASRRLTDLTPVVLMAEALGLQVPTYERQDPSAGAECVCGQMQTVRTVYGDDGTVWCASCVGTAVGCVHCGADPFDENMIIVEDREQTFMPVCRPCIDGARAEGIRLRTVTRQPAVSTA
ncbi:hypothetical protein ACFZAM_12500 [Streptomyces sp. NPDC008079]|uniref:hypothetical protein n=1 Tax=Streptomyces sp. NPDC008079 TaxID=3364806 RepID=UPI0036F0BC0C